MSFAPRAWIGVQSMGTTLLQMSIPRVRQLAAGVYVAQKHRSECFARLRTDEPSLHQSRYAVDPRQFGGIT